MEVILKRYIKRTLTKFPNNKKKDEINTHAEAGHFFSVLEYLIVICIMNFLFHSTKN